MEEARKYIDFAADFLIFVTACFLILSGVSKISMMQESLHHGLADKGLSTVTEEYGVYHSGEELIATLSLPDGITSVLLNGSLIEGNIGVAVGMISPAERYLVERNADENGKITLVIQKEEVE